MLFSLDNDDDDNDDNNDDVTDDIFFSQAWERVMTQWRVGRGVVPSQYCGGIC